MGMLINSCKKNDSPSAESLVLGKLARHLRLQSTILVVVQWKMRYVYTYLEHSVTKYAKLIGPLSESISLRITPFST